MVSTAMFPLRVLRPCLWLAGVLAILAPALRAADDGFTATLSADEHRETGLIGLTGEELKALDELVGAELTQARQSGDNALPGTLADRHPGEPAQAAGLDRLTPDQLNRLDELITASMYVRPLPRERPRLAGLDRAVLTEEGSRLRMHGGMSLTVGGGSGGSFHGASAWMSYYDPVTGLGLSVSYSRYSGPGLPYAYPDNYPTYPTLYPTIYAPDYSVLPRTPSTIIVRPEMTTTQPRVYRGDGSGFRGVAREDR